MRVHLYEHNDWQCDYQQRKGHVFTRGRDRILIRESGRRMTVQRTWFDRVLDHHPKPYGNVNDGGEQGGQGIDLHPTYDRAKLDGTIERHAIGWWNADGTPHMPGTRYPLDGTGEPYRRIDGPHYIRAFGPAVGSRDIVARFWLITCAHDVMRRFPLVPFSDGEGPEYSLATMRKNVWDTPHTGALGICRELAWSLRCVVEAQRVAPSEVFAFWIRTMIATIYLGQAINGACERHAFGQGLAQEEAEARAFGIADGEEWCTSWQHPFLIRAVREAMVVVPSTYTHGRAILERIKPWWANVAFVPGEDNAPHGLPRYLIVARNGIPLSEITLGFGPARPYYDEDAQGAFAQVGL